MTRDRQKTPGYPEEVPGDKDEAQTPVPRKPRNPDEGGMQRDPEPETSTD